MASGLGDTRLSGAGEGAGHVRLWPIVGVIVLVFFVFALRLFQLQILEGDDFANRSKRNSVRTERIEAPRGNIVDREGRILATSRPAFGVKVIPNEVRDPARTYRVLAALLGQDAKAVATAVGEPRGRRRFQPVELEADMDRAQKARVEVHRYALPGTVISSRPLRAYVGGEIAAHLLGTIGEINARELERPEFAGYRPSEIIGKVGLEAALEHHLRGLAGGRNMVVDVAGREIEELDYVEPLPGGRVVLTLDLDLQAAAEAAFAPDPTKVIPPEDGVGPPSPAPEKMGAIVALDPRTGDVLAMVSRPVYDPNAFAGGIDGETWQRLNADEWTPLRNRAIAGHYPPGSTYKAIVAAAGLQEQLVDPSETVFCPGYYRLGRRTYRCWKRGGHGEVNLARALSQSCDVYFYQLGLALGIDTLARYAMSFGLGGSTGIALRGEATGLIPTRDWKKRVKQQEWIKGETVSASIGQGFNLITPLQLAVAYAAIANGGKVLRPRLVMRLETWDGEVLETVEPEVRSQAEATDEVLAIVRDGLRDVVMDPDGTGARARVPGVEVAGKTGTTQVVGLDLVAGLEPEEIPLRYRDHALFASFAPAKDPEIVVVAVAEHSGEGGGRAAAPMAQRVLARYFEKKAEHERLDAAEIQTAAAALTGTPGTAPARPVAPDGSVRVLLPEDRP